MKVRAIKTGKVRVTDRDLLSFLDKYVTVLKEGSVLAITSKVVAILEGAVVPMEGSDKEDLIAQEADLWLPAVFGSTHKTILTIKNSILSSSAGIDESNGDGFYILWPKNPQRSANSIRTHLAKKFGIRKLGILITDSSSRPMRRGASGIPIAHSGFMGLNNYVGSKDVFGRRMKVTKANILEALAASAVLVMGEGSEQKPLAVLEDVPMIRFQSRNPSKKELEELKINPKDDLYSPLMKGAKWKKGKS